MYLIQTFIKYYLSFNFMKLEQYLYYKELFKES